MELCASNERSRGTWQLSVKKKKCVLRNLKRPELYTDPDRNTIQETVGNSEQQCHGSLDRLLQLLCCLNKEKYH